MGPDSERGPGAPAVQPRRPRQGHPSLGPLPRASAASLCSRLAVFGLVSSENGLVPSGEVQLLLLRRDAAVSHASPLRAVGPVLCYLLAICAVTQGASSIVYAASQASATPGLIAGIHAEAVGNDQLCQGPPVNPDVAFTDGPLGNCNVAYTASATISTVPFTLISAFGDSFGVTTVAAAADAVGRLAAWLLCLFGDAMMFNNPSRCLAALFVADGPACPHRRPQPAPSTSTIRLLRRRRCTTHTEESGRLASASGAEVRRHLPCPPAAANCPAAAGSVPTDEHGLT